ncbi:MAG: sulfotransferase [Gammaproteobacteria bacterium]
MKGHTPLHLLPEATPLANLFFPVERDAVLLISLPRGGSSWIGSVLGSASNAAYLREPITQSYMRDHAPCASFFDPAACRDPIAYRSWSSNAFRGIPSFDQRIIIDPGQWRLLQRRRRHIVIKEVNPLCLEQLIADFSPRVIYLLRHPAAVAASFAALGWSGDQFSARFTASHLSRLSRRFDIDTSAGPWKQLGALQAITQNLSNDALRGHDKALVVRYEDICVEPMERFRTLFNFADLNWDRTIEERIGSSASSLAGDYTPGRYDLERDSRSMATRWKQLVSEAQLQEVREGYFANHPLFYKDDADWVL